MFEKRIKCNSGNPRPILLRLNDMIIEKLVLLGKKCRAEKKNVLAPKKSGNLPNVAGWR